MRMPKLNYLSALILATALSVGCGSSTEPQVLNEGGLSEEDVAEMEAYEADMEEYEGEYEE